MMKIVLTSVGVLLVLAIAGLVWMSFRLSPDVGPGDALPALTLTDLEGKPVDVRARHAGKVILLDFWSST